MNRAAPAPLHLPPPPGDGPLLVGFSGGLDSSVLLRLLASDDGLRRRGLQGMHVHHGLQAQADAWAAHCADVCAALDVPLQVVRVDVVAEGDGPEAAARAARYAAFAQALAPGGVLALAHHRDDQAETFLLRALRGSGPEGLAAMRAWRPFARGGLWRPLLHISRDALLAHARMHRLTWIEDPDNANAARDRNYLRHHIMPALRERWPHADASFARSAALAAEADELLADEDARYLATLSIDALDTLSTVQLRALPRERRARVLRRWIATLGLPPLPNAGIQQIESQLLADTPDRHARLEWAGAVIERWRDRMHACTAACAAALPRDWHATWDGCAPLHLPGDGALSLQGTEHFDAPMQVRARIGGERIVLPGRMHSHALKHVLQDRAVAPWDRRRMPLLIDDDGAVLAAGDAILSGRFDTWLRQRDAWLQWQPHARAVA